MITNNSIDDNNTNTISTFLFLVVHNLKYSLNQYMIIKTCIQDINTPNKPNNAINTIIVVNNASSWVSIIPIIGIIKNKNNI